MINFLSIKKPKRIHKYFDFIYTKSISIVMLMIALAVFFLSYRLLNNTLYSVELVKIFWENKVLASYGKLLVLIVMLIPTTFIPMILWATSDHGYYKHIFVFKNTYLFRISVCAVVTLFACVSCYIASPGLIVRFLSEGYFDLFKSLLTTILGYVATVVTIVGISIQQFLKSNHMNLMKFSKKLIKFSDLRPVNSSMINLDIGASSPFLEVVQDELNKWHDFVLDYAPTASQVWNCANAIYPPLQSSGIRPSKSTRRIHKIEWKGVNYLRYKLSELLHCKSENIILTSSTTRAIQIALEILEPNHIIITDKEYLMSSSLLNNFNINKGVEIHTVPLLPANCPSSEWEKTLVKNIINECKGKDKCTLIISHVCYENGIILPLDEISSLLKNSQLSSNVSIIIDAAHALGHVDFNLDIESCFYAFSGHKWLFGGCNLGGLVIPDSVRNDQSMETKIISLVHESLSLPPGLVKTQNKLSSGSIDPFVGLTTSLDALMITGFDNIKDNVVVLRKLMIQLLSESSNSIEIVKYSVPNEFIAPGILNIKAAGQAAYKVKLQRVKQILEDKNILVGHLNSGTTETLRICIPFYLLKKEVGIIAESIKSAFEEARNNP